jgi:hypothetical protein
MFMLTMGAGMNFGFPDVCNTPTPVGPVPIPYPNIAMSATTDPAAYTVLTDAMPSLNQMSEGLVSVGDEVGTLLGVADGDISGGTTYFVGCITIFVEGAPAQRLTSVTGQNAMGKAPNAPGTCVCPSQTTVLTLG